MDGSVTSISKTVQEFRGERFYLCGNYFQHNGKRLHRLVWETHNGEIPEGYHVHHIDEDRANNNIENLALMPGLAHIAVHARSEKRRENGRRAIRLAIQAAPEWHKSENGRAWHSKQAKAMWEARQESEYICTMCGATFASRHVYRNGNRFCGPNCRAKYGRWKRAGRI